jgi:DNA mismatch endonuclease (patch repair protein)
VHLARRLSAEKRKAMMSSIHSFDTKPEMRVRSLLHRMGYRFRVHCKDLPGRPDIVLPRHKKVVFVNGCFWHGHDGCSKLRIPTANRDYWESKIHGNVERDSRRLEQLRQLGWNVFVVWECETESPKALQQSLLRFMDRRNT